MSRLSKQQMIQNLQEEGIRDLMGRKHFRRLILTLLDNASMDTTTYRPGSPHDTSYLEGHRALGLFILDTLTTAEPTSRLLLEQERLAVSIELSPQGTPDENEPL